MQSTDIQHWTEQNHSFQSILVIHVFSSKFNSKSQYFRLEGHIRPLNWIFKDCKMTPACSETTCAYVTLQAAESGYVMNSGGSSVIYSCKCFIFNYASKWMKRFIDDPEAPHFDKKNKEGKKNQHIH